MQATGTLSLEGFVRRALKVNDLLVFVFEGWLFRAGLMN